MIVQVDVHASKASSLDSYQVTVHEMSQQKKEIQDRIRLLLSAFGDRCKQFYFKQQISTQQDRVRNVLDACRIFLAQRTHQELQYELYRLIPETFGFESCGVLFYEPTSGQLFMIDSVEDLRTSNVTAENMVRVPPDVGLTGIAVKAKKTMVFNNVPDQNTYSADIDNPRHIDVRDLLVCPFFNKDRLSGVLQLTNKKGNEPISQQDIAEIGAIGPALSMVLDLCDS